MVPPFCNFTDIKAISHVFWGFKSNDSLESTTGFSTPTKPVLYSKCVNLIEMAKIEH